MRFVESWVCDVPKRHVLKMFVENRTVPPLRTKSEVNPNSVRRQFMKTEFVRPLAVASVGLHLAGPVASNPHSLQV
jgi:hypothetical protein